ncbi:MAG TPA: YCF48-related protein, partial [Nevskia sp.]|nr:YCF48-related protein [Nevskia sp.]
ASAQQQDAAPAAAAKAAAVQPEPAEQAPLAAHGLLLRVVNSGKHLLAVGEHGDIVASNDGVQWAQVDAPVRSLLTSLSFPDPDHGWAVGHDSAILHTDDGGRSWKLQHFDAEAQKPLMDVLFVDSSRAYAVGSFGSFLATKDGGATWSELDAPAIRADGLHLNAILKLNDGELFLAGESGLLGVSADGAAWERLKSPYEGSWFGALPWGAKGALLFGLRGNVYLADDVHAGPWRKLDLGTTQSIFGGALLQQGGAVLVGADGLTVFVRPDGSLDFKRFLRIPGEPGGGTLAGVIEWRGELLAAGEFGIERRRFAN